MKRRLFLQQSSVLGAGLMASSLGVANNNESSVFTPESPQPVELVNPAMGSAKSRWFYFSSACRPFGMVNLSPDTDDKGTWKSGYRYNTPYIRFFSHIHAWELSGVAVMPTVGEFKGHLGNDVYKSSFKHDTEIIKPGYHKVVLDDYNITAELTSTTRVGFHKYTFPESKQSYILFDLGAQLGQGPKAYAEAWKLDNTAICGYEIMDRTGRRPKNTPVYFYAKFNKPFKSTDVWRKDKLSAGEKFPNENTRVSGDSSGVGFAIKYETKENEEVLFKVAISYVSIEQAKLNMDKELAHWDFNKVKQESFDEWNLMLRRIEVEGGTKTEQIRFYTDLWHSLLGRRTISDADGKYMDMTGDYPRVKEASRDKHGKPFPHYNFDALWGAQWSLNTLWGIAYPDIYDGFCNTLVDMYNDGGLIPRGPSGGNYTYVMIGDPAAWFIGSAYQKGIRTYDVKTAYEGLRKNAFIGGIRDRAGYEFRQNPIGGGMNYYIDLGYVPFDRHGDMGTHTKATTSMTLEYAFSDWCLSQMAKSLGKNDDYELFKKRSANFKNVWNPKSGFMEPRLFDGQFTNDFNPFELGAFCESNSYIYSWFVPHNIKELARMMGGEKAAAERLHKQFENSVPLGFGRKWVDYSNEPGMGLGHVFNHLGHPWLTQYWIRTVQASFMDVSPEGGYRNNDEDQGLMGSMHALFSIGLFQLTSGADAEPFYEISTPIFDKVTIHLDNDYYPGETFVIETKNNSAQNVYIHSAELNGAPLNNCWFYHKDLIKGGKLELVLSDKPNKKWGIGEIPVGT